MPKLSFPANFLWGASTAGHQVDGNTKSQWDAWEATASQRLPAINQKQFRKHPRWAEIRAEAARPETYVAGQATDHYNRYRQDFDILEQLNMNAFRFSIEWSRVEPAEGVWDDAVIGHYREYIRQLRQRGIEPFATLWHFTHPQWFEAKHGWERKQNLKYFDRYVQKITRELGSELSFVSPLNEPNVYALLSYALGDWPPQRRNPLLAWRVFRNLARAHQHTYKLLKQDNPGLQVGSCLNFSDNKLLTRSPLARLAVGLQDIAWFGWFENRIRRCSDFIGVNFYMTNYYTAAGLVHNPVEPVSDFGWYMEPSGIRRVLTKLYRRYKLPLYITENGLADRNDTYRQWWIAETITAMEQALADGVDLRGYLHWSLLDNYEWAAGWLMQFGLVHVDRTTLRRTVRPSAQWFGDKIKRYRSLET